MIILGSSGSIGLNALNLAKEYNLKVDALACKSSLKVLNAQIEEFSPKLVYIDDFIKNHYKPGSDSISSQFFSYLKEKSLNYSS